MGSDHNRIRQKWQDYSGNNASKAEKDFFTNFQNIFENTNYRIRSKPTEFQNIYVDIKLSETELGEIYTPPITITRHGVSPDYAIDNLITHKTIYIEVKRQDGWVENKERKAGRGNAHERSCKFFTPGLLKILRKHSGITETNLPFWTVFQGDITRDPCRVREIRCWYDDYDKHLFFWRDAPNPDLLFKHFDDYIIPLLEF